MRISGLRPVCLMVLGLILAIAACKKENAYVPPPPGVAASQTSNVAGPSIEVTTDPNPPARGKNRVTVALRDAAGKPVTAASVSVEFFMAAMPAMNMSAMRASVDAREEAPGVYAGIADLHSGGTWQVTVIATAAGKTIASKHQSMSVSGPMSM